MLKLEIRSPHSKQFFGDKFAEVMRIDYENSELAFVAGLNGNKPMLYIQKGFSDTEFRLHESKSHKERN
nr:hypothetical protein [uncultured Campylobacter sp.]